MGAFQRLVAPAARRGQPGIRTITFFHGKPLRGFVK